MHTLQMVSAVWFLKEKKINVYLLAFNLLSMEIQVNVIHSWMNV